MREWFENVAFSWVDVLDILVVSFLIYWVLRLIRGTRAVYMLVGLTVIVAVYWLSSLGGLYTLNWILSHFLGSLLLIVVVVFQNDIRRLLTRAGRTPVFSVMTSPQDWKVVEELVKASISLANKKIGALMVLERNANVLDYVETGINLDALISRELIWSIFHPSSPIHDGAVIVQKGRIVAAGAFLPLAMSSHVDAELGTRHRAAIGLTEETDALVIVVSEEKGWISVAREGRLTRGLDGPGLRRFLVEEMGPRPSVLGRLRQLVRDRSRKGAS